MYLLFRTFSDCYCQSLISAKKTGRWVISPTKSEIFLIVPNFLSRGLFGNSYIKFFILDIAFVLLVVDQTYIKTL